MRLPEQERRGELNVRDDLHQFRPAYLKIQNNMKYANSALSWLDFHGQIQRALEPIRRSHLATVRVLESPGRGLMGLREISRASDHLLGVIDRGTGLHRALTDLGRVHETWMRGLKPLQESLGQVQVAAGLCLGDAAYRLTVTERLLAKIDVTPSRLACFLPGSLESIGGTINNLASAYGKLVDGIQNLPEVTYMPAFVLPGATRELFTTACALETACVLEEPDKDLADTELLKEIEQETSPCADLLKMINPQLMRPYMGAREALSARGPDRARHFLSSLRELWNHLLRALAPDDSVLVWLRPDRKDLLDEKGRPTRKARILYLCRYVNFGPLSEFVDQDTSALLKLLDVFNRVHQLEPNMTDDQLRTLWIRSESGLMYVLELCRLTS